VHKANYRVEKRATNIIRKHRSASWIITLFIYFFQGRSLHIAKLYCFKQRLKKILVN